MSVSRWTKYQNKNRRHEGFQKAARMTRGPNAKEESSWTKKVCSLVRRKSTAASNFKQKSYLFLVCEPVFRIWIRSDPLFSRLPDSDPLWSIFGLPGSRSFLFFSSIKLIFRSPIFSKSNLITIVGIHMSKIRIHKIQDKDSRIRTLIKILSPLLPPPDENLDGPRQLINLINTPARKICACNGLIQPGAGRGGLTTLNTGWNNPRKSVPSRGGYFRGFFVFVPTDPRTWNMDRLSKILGIFVISRMFRH
jgi:hypothetical protein